jgi:hypothetical protein
MGLATVIEIKTATPGVNDNDVIVALGGPDVGNLSPTPGRDVVLGCTSFFIECTLGTIKVEVFVANAWVAATIASVAATDQATFATTIAAGNAGYFYGWCRGIRIKQSGAPAANGIITGRSAV